jgi:hypothetical protein
MMVSTNLLICGKNIDDNLITQSLKLKPVNVTREGELKLPSLVDGAARNYDSRLGLDCWKCVLTSKQYRFELTKQLEFWIEKLYSNRSSFKEFNDLGYWSVIDCQLTTEESQLPSIQFRLTKELNLKFAEIGVDIDFTVYRSLSST